MKPGIHPPVRPRRLPRPGGRLRLPHPVHRHQREDGRVGGRQHLPRDRCRGLLREPPLLYGDRACARHGRARGALRAPLRRPGMTQFAVTLVGGLHSDARKAAVERLLATVPGSVALHHDLSTAVQGTVVRTVRDARGVRDTGEAPSAGPGGDHLHRLQGHRSAQEVHLGPRQDPRPPGDAGERPAAAAAGVGDQERAGDGAAAVRLRPLTRRQAGPHFRVRRAGVTGRDRRRPDGHPDMGSGRARRASLPCVGGTSLWGRRRRSCNRGTTPRARASAHALAYEQSYDPGQLT